MATLTYSEIFSFVNLLAAHERTRRGKLRKGEVARFELNKAEEIYRLFRELQTKKYRIGEYRTFSIYEPKKRRVDATAYRDRVVQNCFVENYLFPLLERRLIYGNAACRKGKGTDFARKRMRMFLTQMYRKYGRRFYVLTLDIHSYFASIDHEVLKNKMRKIVADEETLSFIEQVIDSYDLGGGKGVPLGNQSSQCFALFYLDGFDRVVKERFRIRCYSRYMDDAVAFCENRETLVALLAELKALLAQLGLEINVDRTAVVPISQGVTYLGFTYHLGPSGKLIAKMAKGKRRRLRRHLDRHQFKPESLLCYRNYLIPRCSEPGMVRFIDGLSHR